MAKDVSLPVIGLLPRDHAGASIQTAANFVTQDASPTPKMSPLAYTTSITTLEVSADSVQFIAAPTTNLRVSEKPDMASYYVVPAGAAEPFTVTFMVNVYIRADDTAGTLNFQFLEV